MLDSSGPKDGQIGPYRIGLDRPGDRLLTVRITSFDQAEIAVLDLEAKSWTTIIRGGSFASVSRCGYL